MSRLTSPLLLANGQYREISYADAFRILQENIADATENETLVLTSGDYSNEELYLIQKNARAAFNTNALGSFDYYQRGTAFFHDKNDIVPFAELYGSDLLLWLWDDSAQTLSARRAQMVLEACTQAKHYHFNKPDTLHIHKPSLFFRGLNHYLIQHDLAKGIYLDGLGKNYEAYREKILQEDFSTLLASNNLQESQIQDIVNMLIHAEAPVFVVWERLLDERGVIELENLCMLLDIQAKPSSGFLCIKADLNSQGLYDMGIFPDVCVGGEPFREESITLMESLYQKPVCTKPVNITNTLQSNGFRNILVMNATSSPIPEEVQDAVRSCTFSVLQTASYPEGYTPFQLILPASLPEECTGTFTDSTRTPHQSKPDHTCPLPFNNLQLFSAIGQTFGLPDLQDSTEIFMEYISFFKGGCHSTSRHFFR